MSILNHMSRKQVDKLMSTLIAISSSAIPIGVFFQLEHYPYAKEILWIGIPTALIFSSMEINRLKRIIRELEEKV